MVSASLRFGAIAFVIGVVCITENYGYSLPSYMKPCDKLESECLTSKANEYVANFARGIPELDVRTLDPHYIDKVDLNIAGLHLNLKKLNVTGMRKCHIDKLDMQLENHKVFLDATCNFTVKGKYNLKGKFVALNVDSDGDVKIKIKQLVVKASIGFKVETRDGEEYLKLNKKYKQTNDIIGYVHLDLSNLFGGNNQLLAAPVLQIFNQNWKELFNEFGSPIVGNIIDLIVENNTNFFNKIPRSGLLSSS